MGIFDGSENYELVATLKYSEEKKLGYTEALDWL